MIALICPFCGAPLARENNSLYCGGERRHCFDIAKSGYVTLTRAPGSSGDDREMVRARTAFLDSGCYLPFANAVADAIDNAYNKADGGLQCVIDAGCGEGYYTSAFAEHNYICGIDISKDAVRFAAKRCVRRRQSARKRQRLLSAHQLRRT